MMKRNALAATAVVGLVALAMPAGLAWANHIRIEVSGEAQPMSPKVAQAQSTSTVVVPAQPPVTFPETLQADAIRAQQVRARTIYANKISADEIRGAVFQTGGVELRETIGDVRAPEVTASVIYADDINANSVVADAIYVRRLEQR